MKTLLALLLLTIAAAANGQSGTVNILWDSAYSPTKFTLYQQPQGSTVKFKLVDNIPGSNRSLAFVATNSVWYTLTMTSTVTMGSGSQESSHSNVLQFQFIVPPIPIIRLQ